MLTNVMASFLLRRSLWMIQRANRYITPGKDGPAQSAADVSAEGQAATTFKKTLKPIQSL